MKPGTGSVGIGNVANSVGELARSHLEARQALRLTRRAGGRARVASYRSLGAFRLLLEVQSPEALRRFVDERLRLKFVRLVRILRMGHGSIVAVVWRPCRAIARYSGSSQLKVDRSP